MSTPTRFASLGHGVHADILIAVKDGWQSDGQSRLGHGPESASTAVAARSTAPPASDDDELLLRRVSTLTVLKLVMAPRDGMTAARRPHDVVREVRVLRANQHQSIVKLLDYSFDDVRREHILTLPLLAVTLEDVLLDHAVLEHPVDLCLFSATGLFSALAHLHRNAVAHRDIKPANIMFGFDGVPVLIDFGTAWDGASRGDGDEEGAMSCSVGTGPYRAPELLFSPSTYDGFALDLWSAGVALAEFFRPRGKRQNSLGIFESASGSSASTEDEDTGTSQPPASGRHQGQPPGATGPSDTPGDSAAPTQAQAQATAWEDPQALEASHARVEVRETGTQAEPLAPPAPLFSAAFGELGLAASIFRLLGTPTPETWPSFSSLPDAGKMPFDEYPPRPLQDAMPVLDSIPSGPRAHMLRILEDLIVLEPSRRRSADEIIRAIRGATYHDVDAAALLRPFIIQVARRAELVPAERLERHIHALMYPSNLDSSPNA